MPAAQHLRQKKARYAAYGKYERKFYPLRNFMYFIKKIFAGDHYRVVKRAEKPGKNAEQYQQPVCAQRYRFRLVAENRVLPEKQLGYEIRYNGGNDSHAKHGFIKGFMDLLQHKHNARKRRVERRRKPRAGTGAEHAQLGGLICPREPCNALCRHRPELNAGTLSAQAQPGKYGDRGAEKLCRYHFPPARREYAFDLDAHLRYAAGIRHMFYDQ